MRRALFRLFPIAAAAAATIAGCGAPNQLHSTLPPTSAGSALAARSTAPVDADAALESAVAGSHGEVTGSAPYGVLDGHFVPAQPAPGRPGYYLVDGETVPEPPDESAPSTAATRQSISPAPQAAATPNCNGFTGNVPPPCTVTGPFRRVYSDPGYSFALAHVTLPLVTTMPAGKDPVDGSTGYIYFEGWPSPTTANSEFGFQYSATHQTYTLYARTSNPVGYFIFELNDKAVHYLPNNTITFALAGYNIGNQNYLHVAAIGTSDVTCGATVHLCLAHDHLLDKGWTPSSCCIMARMTSIGQTDKTYEFYDGAEFGPVTWSGAELAAVPPTPAPGSTTLPLTGKEPAWSGGASQSWPPPIAKWPDKLDRIMAADVSATGETDTIDLTVPDLKVSISPASCQYVAKKGTLSYSTSVEGSADGITLDSGWYVYGQSILPIGVNVPNQIDELYGYKIGPGKAASVQIFDASSKGGFATDIYTGLFFVDALGNMRGYPASVAFAEFAVGKVHC